MNLKVQATNALFVADEDDLVVASGERTEKQ